jgi:hypothetical protein
MSGNNIDTTPYWTTSAHVFAVCQMADDLVTDVVRSGVTGVMAAYFGTGRGASVERG